ncbi:helix-turn-helix domain-containing protein [Janibacter melonis]|uniref:helix-turn-helix domain-containing protein n=1 Tax=Janibacter melonis TaxID=262209 RepID=UPI002042CBA3|nr:helix-turn-helix domain-containing protein [Janibacter melonis]MCM3554009.1 helix-turn-helix domain-containing protein [Janibacter melonis]
MAELWWRQTWMEAVWSSDLKPLERLVAGVYADHAHDQRTSWVTLDRLAERTGLGRTQAQRWRKSLVESGWIVEVQKARQQRAAVYGLVIPEASVPDTRQPDEALSMPGNRQPDEPRVPEYVAQGAGIPDSGCRGTGTNQSSYPKNPISLSREQQAVKDLLGQDATDERLVKVPNLIEQSTPRSPVAWLRACHKNGDLLALLDACGTEASLAPEGWGTTARAESDGLMVNPDYIEGMNASRIEPEDYYRPKLERLGLIHGVIEQYRIDAERIHPNGSKEKVWAEAWMTALTDHRMKETA